MQQQNSTLDLPLHLMGLHILKRFNLGSNQCCVVPRFQDEPPVLVMKIFKDLVLIRFQFYFFKYGT
jgi:hypothetical protein